jgi:hypothetical protein
MRKTAFTAPAHIRTEQHQARRQTPLGARI